MHQAAKARNAAALNRVSVADGMAILVICSVEP